MALRTPAMPVLAAAKPAFGRSSLPVAASLGLREYATRKKPVADPNKKISASSPSKTAGRTKARYQFRPPRYYRGPLHPIQPPKPSAPNSREFIPGPFGRERKGNSCWLHMGPELGAESGIDV